MDRQFSLRSRGAIASIAVVAGGLTALGSTATATASPVASSSGAASSAVHAADFRPNAVSTPQRVAALPNASNTGVPVGTKLRRHNGNITVRRAGTVLDRLDIRGFVIVKAPNVTIRRSIIRGGIAPGDIGLVTNTTPSATNLVIKDSELYPAHPSVRIDGIKGGNFTAQRVDVHGTVDSIKVHGNNVTVVDSYLHHNRWFAHDPNQHGGPTHNDAVQVLGGRNILIQHNSMSGASNAALQVTQDYSRVENMVFRDNYVNGGACTVNLARKPLSSMQVTVVGNRFGPHRVYGGCGIVASHGTTVLGAGNVWNRSGARVAVRRQG